jgi:putative acetyltransferase
VLGELRHARARAAAAVEADHERGRFRAVAVLREVEVEGPVEAAVAKSSIDERVVVGGAGGGESEEEEASDESEAVHGGDLPRRQYRREEALVPEPEPEWPHALAAAEGRGGDPLMRVRPVTKEDVPAVVSLVRTTLAEFGLTFGEGSDTDEQVKCLPESYDQGGGGFWVAEDEGGVLLGTCGVYPVTPGDMELRKMYLSPAARGKGVGKRLLEESIAFCRARGARRMVLDTIEEMTRAIAFYERNGFVRDDAQVRGERCSRGYVRLL